MTLIPNFVFYTLTIPIAISQTGIKRGDIDSTVNHTIASDSWLRIAAGELAKVHTSA